MKRFKRIRDAITGQFTTAREAKARPAETIAETVPVRTAPPRLQYGLPELVIRNAIWEEVGDSEVADRIAARVMERLGHNGHRIV